MVELLDRDDEGCLQQLFTKPVLDRPAMYFGIIQRMGARSFGKGNFRAWLEAMAGAGGPGDALNLIAV